MAVAVEMAEELVVQEEPADLVEAQVAAAEVTTERVVARVAWMVLVEGEMEAAVLVGLAVAAEAMHTISTTFWKTWMERARTSASCLNDQH